MRDLEDVPLAVEAGREPAVHGGPREEGGEAHQRWAAGTARYALRGQRIGPESSGPKDGSA